jgi:tryptophan-rich sensory protein
MTTTSHRDLATARRTGTGSATPERPAGRSPVAQVVAMVVSISAVVLVSGIGRLVTETGTGSWYEGLDQPSWNPPDWLFGPVWTLLYLAMAVSAWLVWRAGHRRPLAVYAVQLALNLAWTLVFFGLESTWGGVAVIAALLVAISATIEAFRPVPLAAWLLVPYIGWVAYAAALNLAIAAAS